MGRYARVTSVAMLSMAALGCDAAAQDRRAPGARPAVARTQATSSGRCAFPASAAVPEAAVPDGYCVWALATGLSQPRGLFVTDEGDVLVVERGESRVVALHDDDGDGVVSDDERSVVAAAPGLNHGLVVHAGYLYASSASTVFRWRWRPHARQPLRGREVVVRGIPEPGHSTRTLVARGDHLWVSVGSLSNVDADSRRARVVRYDVRAMPAGGYAWGGSGELWADGLRNEVGLAFDPSGVLWGVQNGVDELHRDDLGGDVHADNPAEELNRLDRPGAFHGYPYCWTEYLLARGRGRGTQWAHSRFRGDGVHTDAWCRDPSHVTPPAFSMQAHSAPLGLVFYAGSRFPADARGDVFVAFHGSWNRPEPTGYRVNRIRFRDGAPRSIEPFLRHRGAEHTDASWPHRPVNVAIDAIGRLVVTSDRSGFVLVVDHRGG